MDPYGKEPPTVVHTRRGTIRLLGNAGGDTVGGRYLDLGTPDAAVRTAVEIITRAADLARCRGQEPPRLLVLATGDPFDGLELHGPFIDGDDIDSLTEGRFRATT
jgi:hypothetical protein